MQTFITIIYVIVALMMVLAILLQAGKGGGLGSALGGGASQTVFGGGGGADFMAKLTQGFAATFMICAMYLAYASAHAGSKFLEGEDAGSSEGLEADQPVDFERLGNLQLWTPEEGKARQTKAAALVPAQSETQNQESPTPSPVPETGNGVDNRDSGDSPEDDRGESPQSGEESLQHFPENPSGSNTEKSEGADPIDQGQ